MSYIYFLALLNVVLAVVMIIYNWKLNRNIIHFSVFLLAVSVTSVLFDTVLNGGLPEVLLYSAVFAVSFSFYAAPSLFLFVRGLVTDRVLFDRKDLLHIIPLAASLLLLLPFLFQPEEVQLDFARNSLGNMSYYMNSRLTVMPVWLLDIIQVLISLVYLFAALVLLNRKFGQKWSGLLIPIRQQYKYSRIWLNVILLVSLALVVLRIGLILYFLTEPENYDAFKNEYQFAVSTSVNTLLTLLVMLNPKLMYGFPQPRNVGNAAGQSSATGNVEDMPQREPLQNEYFSSLCNRILEEMEDSKPYLMPEFNLYHLTVSLDAPQHHIQFCINSIMKKKFADFKGEYRIKHALYLMTTELHKRKTPASIAYESGFASVESFYSTFSEITGLTPDQWISENT